MAITYDNLRTKVLNALGETSTETYTDELVYDAVCGAIVAIAPWISVKKIVTIDTDGDNDTFALPADLYRINAVRDADTGHFGERLSMTSEKKSRVAGSAFEWLDAESGKIFFPITPDVGKKIVVHYDAYYGLPATATDITFSLEIPRSATMGVVYWASAHCLVPQGVTSSRIRQFNQRVDSGTPVDNVIEQSARFLRSLFMDEMNRLPKQIAGI